MDLPKSLPYGITLSVVNSDYCQILDYVKSPSITVNASPMVLQVACPKIMNNFIEVICGDNHLCVPLSQFGRRSSREPSIKDRKAKRPYKETARTIASNSLTRFRGQVQELLDQ